MKKTRSSSGLAAIIDSLLFICIVSVVALLILESGTFEIKSEELNRSSMIHSVLVHCTISVDENDGGANRSEAQVSDLLCPALGSGDVGLIDRLSTRLGQISNSLVESPYHYRWIISGTGHEIAIGENAIPGTCDVMASSMEMRQGEEVVSSTFYLWIL